MTSTHMIVARHGNTFDKGDVIRRIGRGTDLPLSASGQKQAHALGAYLLKHNLKPSMVFCSFLRRTRETALLALEAAGWTVPVQPLALFDEIDYGPDENQPEDAVRQRLGPRALQAWDARASVPAGWDVDPPSLIRGWQHFAREVENSYGGETVLVVTSNGIARFAPHLTGDFEAFSSSHSLKMATGAMSLFEKDLGAPAWTLRAWNVPSGSLSPSP